MRELSLLFVLSSDREKHSGTQKSRDWNLLSNADVKPVSRVPQEQVFACKKQVLRAFWCGWFCGAFFFFLNVLKGIYPFSPFQLEKAPLADSGLECRARAIPKLRGWQVFLSLMRGRRIAQMKQGIKLCKFSCYGSSIV